MPKFLLLSVVLFVVAACLPLRVQAQIIPQTPNEQAKIIDGVITYGDENPLDITRLNKLIGELNIAFSRGQLPRQTNTLYGSISLNTSAYLQFRNRSDGGESFQSFITRHFTEMNRMTIEANQLLSTYGIAGRIKAVAPVRFCFILVDGIDFPGSYHEGWLQTGIRWVDGHYTIKDYAPALSAYYDRQTRIDRGLIHEYGHMLFDLKDMYTVNMDPADTARTPQLMEGVPADDRQFHIDQRGDSIGRDFMTSAANSPIGLFNALTLARRDSERWESLPFNERFLREFADMVAYANELPGSVVLNYGRPDLAGGRIEIYRSKEVLNTSTQVYEKSLNTQPVLTGTLSADGTINIGNPFKDMTYPGTMNRPFPGRLRTGELTLFLRVYDKDGTFVGYDWMSMPDFSVAKYLYPTSSTIWMTRTLSTVSNYANANKNTVYANTFISPLSRFYTPLAQR